MNKIMYISGILLLTIMFSGCFPKYSPYKNSQRGVMIYEINKEEALNLAYKSIHDIFPDLPISKTKDGTGYFATYKLMNDKQIYTIQILQLQGNLNNKIIRGFSFDIFSEGTYFIGFENTKKLLNHTIKIFNQTDTGIIVQNSIQIDFTDEVVKNMQTTPIYVVIPKTAPINSTHEVISNKQTTPTSAVISNTAPINSTHEVISNKQTTPTSAIIPTTTPINSTNNALQRIEIVHPSFTYSTLKNELQKLKNLYKACLITNKEYYLLRKQLLITNQSLSKE